VDEVPLHLVLGRQRGELTGEQVAVGLVLGERRRIVLVEMAPAACDGASDLEALGRQPGEAVLLRQPRREILSRWRGGRRCADGQGADRQTDRAEQARSRCRPHVAFLPCPRSFSGGPGTPVRLSAGSVARLSDAATNTTVWSRSGPGKTGASGTISQRLGADSGAGARVSGRLPSCRPVVNASERSASRFPCWWPCWSPQPPPCGRRGPRPSTTAHGPCPA